MDKFNWTEEANAQLSHLYPDKENYHEMIRLNKKSLWLLVSHFGAFGFFVIFFAIFSIQANMPFEIVVIVHASLAFGFMCALVVSVTCIAHKKHKIRKKQIDKLRENESACKNQLYLHELMHKYNKKWNRAYLIELIVLTAISILLAIGTIDAEGAELSALLLAVTFGILFFGGPPIIVTLIWNTLDFKKLRKQMKDIENAIDNPPPLGQDAEQTGDGGTE
ncbi:MAG: hypothetical protein LBH24_05325 [Clostridiales bacterium]|jgi:hypothetical protein|nr:hypothetical protein [Clostridiales bacterium]